MYILCTAECISLQNRQDVYHLKNNKMDHKNCILFFYVVSPWLRQNNNWIDTNYPVQITEVAPEWQD